MVIWMAKFLVCGGRDYNDYETLSATLKIFTDYGDTIISGGARGADTLAIKYAKENGLQFERYNADWGLYGKSAGPIRNQRMIDEGKPDAIVAFPGGSGTEDMKQRAKKHGITIYEVKVK